MKILKTKQGFTLIELLVVIGILAVLAAIAIPSVAGLIDRANQSADQTNAGEMTNAMERFVSEYELYCQDIASGRLDTSNLDSAQGRIYNITGITENSQITAIESEYGFNGIRIDKDTKYPQNHQTAKAIIENYMKTSSSTFEPKQSDKAYWYNTVTGYVIVADDYVHNAYLYDKLPSEVKYGISQNANITEWVNLSSNSIIPDIQIINAYFNDKIDYNGVLKCGISYNVEMPNPLYNNIDLNKVYIMYHTESKGFLDMTTAKNVIPLQSCITEEVRKNLEALKPNEVFKFVLSIPTNNIDYDLKRYFRIAYEYEKNGEKAYIYSAAFSFSFNDLLK